jgi:hypothetical protein
MMVIKRAIIKNLRSLNGVMRWPGGEVRVGHEFESFAARKRIICAFHIYIYIYIYRWSQN